MAQTIKFPCGTTLDLLNVREGAHDLIAELEVLGGSLPGLLWVDDDSIWWETKGVCVTVERRTLRPLIQWLTLLEQELR